MQKINVKRGKRYVFPTHINELLLPREESEILEAFYVIIKPDKSTPPHVHTDTEQLYYVVSGTGRAVFTFPDGRREEFEMFPEDVVHVPRNASHQISCTGQAEPLTYLCIDGFPAGKPTDEPTWDAHYQSLIKTTR